MRGLIRDVMGEYARKSHAPKPLIPGESPVPVSAMVGQPGFFDLLTRYEQLSAAGDPLERLAAVIDFEWFRRPWVAALRRGPRGKGGRPPFDAVPDATTVWLLRERLVKAKVIDRLFARFDAALTDQGYLAMGGQIIDADFT